MASILHNGRFYQADSDGSNHSFAECAVVDGAGNITYVGPASDKLVVDAEAAGAVRHDMKGRFVLPGFVDGHVHLLIMGMSLQKCDLKHCKNFEDIRTAIRDFAAANPDVPRIMCKNYMHFMTNGEATAAMLDDLDPRPIFIDSKDLHSTWCNRGGLDEMGVQDMADPEGGKIYRDANGVAEGLLTEAAAVTIAWPHLARVASMDSKVSYLRAAIDSFNAEGYTGVVDMAMDANGWAALQELRRREKLPMRFSAYWLISPTKSEAKNLAQVDEAIRLNALFNAETDPDCRIVGIKIICDGIIDGCTAALTEPYSSNAANPDPVWTPEEIAPIVAKASAAGLQCALHAIGDRAVTMAIDALEQNAKPDQRHRIEHLEMTKREDAARLGKLGITASIQPVHADPAILRAWPSLIGHRCNRAFAYKEFADGGAVLALGSDAPTAPHAPLRNIYTATTRRSAREPELEDIINPEFALDLSSAVAGATQGSAYSVFTDHWAGKIAVGRSADFAVFDMEWSADKLLDTKIVQTWFRGGKVYDAEV